MIKPSKLIRGAGLGLLVGLALPFWPDVGRLADRVAGRVSDWRADRHVVAVRTNRALPNVVDLGPVRDPVKWLPPEDPGQFSLDRHILSVAAASTNELTWQTNANVASTVSGTAAVMSQSEINALAEGLLGNTGLAYTGEYSVLQSSGGASPAVGDYFALGGFGVNTWCTNNSGCTNGTGTGTVTVTGAGPFTLTAATAGSFPNSVAMEGMFFVDVNKNVFPIATNTSATVITVAAQTNVGGSSTSPATSTSSSIVAPYWIPIGSSMTAAALAAAVNAAGYGGSIATNTSNSVTITPVSGTPVYLAMPSSTATSLGLTAGYETTNGHAVTTNSGGPWTWTTGADTWGAGTFTANQSVIINTAGNAHSWLLERSPVNLGGTGNYVYVLVDATSSTVPAVSWSKFAFGIPTATQGINTTAPAAIDQVKMQVTDAINNASVSVPHYTHLSVSSRGDWWFWESFQAGGIYSMRGVTQCNDNQNGSAYTVVGLFAGAGAVATALLSTVSNSSNTWTGTTNKFLLLGNGTPTGSVAMALSLSVSVNIPVLGDGSSSFMSSVDEVNSAYNNLPIYVASGTSGAGTNTIVGRLPDVTWAPNVASGTVSPTGTPYSVMSLAAVIWVPWVTNVGPDL